MFFCPVYITCCKNTLKNAYHNLLVKLGALCEVCGMPKIFYIERVCSSFRILSNKFWCLKLHKSLACEILSKCANYYRLYFKNCSLFICTQSKRQIIKI